MQSRVIHLCHQVDAAIPVNHRWDAKRLLEELESIESTLSVDDLQYIVGHGRYRSIIRWSDIRLKASLVSICLGSIRPPWGEIAFVCAEVMGKLRRESGMLT